MVLSKDLEDNGHVRYHDSKKTADMMEMYFTNVIYGLSLSMVDFLKLRGDIEGIIDNYMSINPDEDEIKALVSLLWHYYADVGQLTCFKNLEFNSDTKRRLNLCKRVFGNLKYF